uniref:Ornithine decarboxylase antizyme n=1 Tax=Panagrolaimus sp. ES5 TaxID=591445 RepID=A0AC34GWW4_9BILA
MSTMLMNSSSVSTVVAALPRPRGWGDVPHSCDENINKVAELVKLASPEFCCHIVEKSTLMLYMPGEPTSQTLSRDDFIELLEQCEDTFNYKRVLVCFDKSHMDPRQGMPALARSLKCVGFNVLPVDAFPSYLNKKTLFCMVYEL